MTRAQAIWDYLKPSASSEGIVPVRPRIDVIDLQLRLRMKELQDDLDLAKTRITTLQARIAALEARLP